MGGKNHRHLPRFIRYAIHALFALWVVYLLAANWILNSAVLKQKFSRHPDRFTMSWQVAISPFPGFVWLNGFSMRTQTPGVQSLLEANSVFGQVDLSALRNRTFHTRWIRASGIQSYVRPRPREGRPFSPLYLHFPPIAGLKTGQADQIVDRDTYLYSDKPPWRIELDNLQLQGFDDIWIWNHRLKAQGIVRGDLGMVTAGQFWISNGFADLIASNLKTNDKLVARQLIANSRFQIDAYRPRDHRGWASLQFVSGDMTLAGEIQGLGFIDYYLGRIEDVKLFGSGVLNARLALHNGRLLPASNFTVHNADMQVRVQDYRFSGRGTLAGGLKHAADDSWLSDLGVHFNKVSIHRGNNRTADVTGSNLEIRVTGPRPTAGKVIANPQLSVRLAHGTASDLAVFNTYLPDSLGLHIEQGQAQISADMSFDRQGFSLNVSLNGELLKSTLGKHPFKSQFETTFVLRQQGDTRQPYLLKGSKIILREATLTNADTAVSGWSTRLQIDEGYLLPGQGSSDKRFRLASGKLVLQGNVSDAGFFNPLLEDIKGLALGGSADLQAEFNIGDGELRSGSFVSLTSSQMMLEFLAQHALGAGHLRAEYERRGEQQTVAIAGRFPDIHISASGAAKAHIKGVDLQFSANGDVTTFSEKMHNLAANIEISDATVTDLTAYNRYLPEDSGLRFESGQGDMEARFTMLSDKAEGNIELTSDVFEMTLRGQRIAGSLALAVALTNGSIERQAFDVGGSSLQLSGRRIDPQQAEAVEWSGQAYVDHGRIRWKTPLALNAAVRLHLDDTAPLVYLFAPENVRNSLVSRMLSVSNVTGSANVGMDDRSVVLNNIQIGADKLGVSAHLRFGDETVDGLVYSTYGALGASVNIEQGEREWKWIGAHKWYENYPPFAIPEIE